jgi:selenocysteine lyase/cysteine desulfurase
MYDKLARLRHDTPATQHCIHLNNAGASLQTRQVQEAVQSYLTLEYEVGGYEAQAYRAAELEGFYTAVANLLGTKAHQIAFATSASDAYARALSSIRWQAGDVLLTTDCDYVSNYIAFLSLQQKLGIRIIRARDLDTGGVDVADVEMLIRRHQPRLVAVTHVPTNSGLVQDVEAIGRICRANDVLYLVDACQSAGQLPLEVEAIGCDFLSATFRKYLRGPRGTGFLFVSDKALDAGLELLLPDMRGANWTAPDQYEPISSARRFEYWEVSPALILGARAAAEYAIQTDLTWIEARVAHLADFTRNLLEERLGAKVLDKGTKRCGITTSWHANWDQQTIVDQLRVARIHTLTTSIGSAQIDFSRKGVDWALRISPHYYNTEAEIETAVAELHHISTL